MFNRVLSAVENTLAAVSFMVVATVAFVNVISRYFLDASLAFTTEITVNVAVWMTMIGAAIAVRERAHLGFTLLHDKARGPIRAAMSVVIGLVMALVLVAIIYYGWDMAMQQRESGRTTPSTGIPQWLLSLALPVGGLLALVRVVQTTASDLRSGESGEDTLEGSSVA